MRGPPEIEDIEEMRRQAGIDDVELREEIRGLAVGDFVKLTLLAGTNSYETLLVRITSIRGPRFGGELADEPAPAGRTNLRAGSRLAFTAAHIHSIPKGRPTRGRGRPSGQPRAGDGPSPPQGTSNSTLNPV